jgi:catechol 2,3-dioxygenase-like lactoylglutathione lyase family enzyme
MRHGETEGELGERSRTMIKGLRGASIWSENLNNLLPFYRDLLGLKVAVQTEGFVVLGDLGGATLALGTHSQVRGRNADPARHMVGLTTNGRGRGLHAAEGRGRGVRRESNRLQHGAARDAEGP